MTMSVTVFRHFYTVESLFFKRLDNYACFRTAFTN